MSNCIRTSFAPALVLLLLVTSNANGATWHVATDGDDTWPGTTNEPFLTIARGIDAAATGDTVLIYDGTYTGEGNRDLDLTGKMLTIRSDSGVPESCILDAEYYAGGVGWNFFTTDSSWGDSTFIEGLTLARGAAGAISVDAVFANPRRAFVLRNCIIDSTTTGIWSWGALSLYDCRFSNCEIGADNGEWTLRMAGPLLAERCQFNNCEVGVIAGSFGGKKSKGNHKEWDRHTRIFQCVFEENGTAVIAREEADVLVRDCTFRGNSIGFRGHEPFIQYDFVSCEFTGNITNCIEASLGWPGFKAVVDSCSIHDNPGNGIVSDGNLGLQVTNTQIVNNGGTGIFARSADGILVSGCIVAGNGGAGLDLGEGGIDPPFREIPVVIEYSTIAYNASGIRISQHDSLSVAISNTLVAMNSGEGLTDFGVTYTSCDVYGNGPDLEPDSWEPWVDGNLELDPLFCGPDQGDFHVSGLSPCSDYAGNAVIGALGVGCDDAVAIDDIELMARWTEEGVELRWSGSTQTFSRSALLNRRDELSGRTDVLASWLAGAFPHTGQYLDQTAQKWRTYSYSVDAVGDHASGTGVRLEPRTALPMASGLTAIYPNPSNPRATIGYILARDEKVQLEIYDLSGRRVRKQDLGVVAAGPGEFIWDGTDSSGRNVAAGSYLVRLIAGNTTDTSRLVIVK